VTRQSYQQGYVSKPIPTRSGTVFKIRYRVKSADGKWKQKSETLYGLPGKKAARAVLDERIREASNQKPEGSDLSLRTFVDAWWKPYLQRKGVKLSTRSNYDSVLQTAHLACIWRRAHGRDCPIAHREVRADQGGKRIVPQDCPQRALSLAGNPFARSGQ
jgi:hypothetical protein